MNIAEHLKLKGWKEGFKEGFIEAFLEGWEQKQQIDRNEKRRGQIREIAANCLALGLDRVLIERATGLSRTEMDSLMESVLKTKQ